MKTVIYVIITVFIININLYCGQWSLCDSSWHYLYTWIDCADSLHCTAIGEQMGDYWGVRTTTDGGKSWATTFITNYTDSIRPRANHISYPDTTLCIIVCRSGYYWISRNKCQTWEYFKIDSTALFRVNFYNNKFGVIRPTVSDSLYIYVTHDGGLNWEKKYYNNPSDTVTPPSSFSDVYCPDNNLIILRAYSNNIPFIVSSSDGGNTWERGKAAPPGLMYLYFIDKNIGWACGSQKVNTETYKEKIFHTSDGGMTWETQLDTLRVIVKSGLKEICFIDENYGYSMGNYHKLWGTYNGGKTWIAVTDTPNHSWDLSDISYPSKDILYGCVWGGAQLWKYTGYFTGVEEEPAIQSINITLYPNPLPSSAPLKMKLWLEFPHEAEISIYNYLGQLMDTQRRQFLNAGESTLQYSDYGYFPPGAYCIVMKIGNRAFPKSFIVY